MEKINKFKYFSFVYITSLVLRSGSVNRIVNPRNTAIINYELVKKTIWWGHQKLNTYHYSTMYNTELHILQYMYTCFQKSIVRLKHESCVKNISNFEPSNWLFRRQWGKEEIRNCVVTNKLKSFQLSQYYACEYIYNS